MANFAERFKAGFALTDQEWTDRREIDNTKKGYFTPSLSSVEFHPTFVERVRRGVRYILKPEKMRADNAKE